MGQIDALVGMESTLVAFLLRLGNCGQTNGHIRTICPLFARSFAEMCPLFRKLPKKKDKKRAAPRRMQPGLN